MIQTLRTGYGVVLLVLVLFLSLIFSASGSVFSQDSKTFQVRKQPEIQQVKPKKPVKIKLRHSVENKYT